MIIKPGSPRSHLNDHLSPRPVGNHRGRHGPHGRHGAARDSRRRFFFARRVTGHHGAAELLPADAPAAGSNWVRKLTYYLIHK
jgi:hypothetical protein